MKSPRQAMNSGSLGLALPGSLDDGSVPLGLVGTLLP